MNAQHSMTTALWYTPPDIVERVRYALGGIDLDPCSDATAQTIVRAKAYYTEADDGLARSWGRRWFCNPPSPAGPWWSHAALQTPGPGVFLAYNIDALHRFDGWSRYALALPRARLRFSTSRQHLAKLAAEAAEKRAAKQSTEEAKASIRAVAARKAARILSGPALQLGAAPAHGSALIGIGVDPARWREAFAPIGEVKL